MTEILPTIVLPKKQAVSSWAASKYFSTRSFQSLKILKQYPESMGDFEEASKEINMYTPFVNMHMCFLFLYLGCFINIQQITATAEFTPSLKFVNTHADPDTPA
jgi:hypothetical protein